MKKITGNQQFDFQINRFTMNFAEQSSVKIDIEDMAKTITNMETWADWWHTRAQAYEAAGQFEIAASYYKAAMFYLIEGEQKQVIYASFQRCFYQYYHEFDYERGQVPYENSSLPTLLLKNKGATKTLLVIGGFDGYLEEVATFFNDLKGIDYNILIFDGPGQGNTSSNGLKFIPNFEKPVATVLDYYHLKDVAAVGLSWGGLLVMRAAAFEKRIKQVIAMDIFYSPMDTLKMNMGLVKYTAFNVLLTLRTGRLVNHLMTNMATKSIDLTWKLNNGYQLTGEQQPYDLILNLKRHNAKTVLPFVNQECLLLAGSEDQYVPVKRLKQIKHELVNSGGVRAKCFTKETGGEQHCQVGRMDLAMTEIKKFLIQ